MAERIFITGGSGLLGLNWACCRRDRNEVWLGIHEREVALEGVHPARVDLDDAPILEKTLERVNPALIVHMAAMTDVDRCQLDAARAMAINADAAGMIARLAFDQGCRFIHVSTDHLFDGQKANRTEDDIPSPVNIYGQSKAEGEKRVMENNPDALILRVNFFGWGTNYRASFSDWIIGSLSSNRSIALYDNVMFTPLYVDRLAEAGHQLVDKGEKGIFHVASSDRISKFTFGRMLADRFHLDKDLIRKGSYDSDENIPRPLDMSLDNRKLLKALGRKELSVAEDIERLYHDRKRHAELKRVDVRKQE